MAAAKEFVRLGAKVIITGRDEVSLRQACNSVTDGEHDMDFATCDVADTDAINACVDSVSEKYGHIDTLINCAGVNTRKPAIDFTPDEYDRIMDINLRGAFFMAQAVGKKMIAARTGNQINIDSLSTLTSLARVAPYSMSKSGLSNMTRALALEWGRYGVRVNGLAPGFILTDLTKKMWSEPNMQAWNKTVTPLQRLGEVEDLTGAMVFLASPAAAFVTG
ncbi:MAG: SDR family oxidoreductase, partial [Hyphomicrobiales bacterium]